MIITSAANEKVKFLRSLKSKKCRTENNLYIAEGHIMVDEAIRSNQKIKYLVKSSDIEYNSQAFELLILSPAIFKSISDAVSPQGILAVIEKPPPKTADDKCSSLLLDGISEPGNLGGIIRTAAAVGYRDIYMVGCCDAYSPKSVRSSMGGIFKVNLIDTSHSDINIIKQPIIIADMSGENIFNTETVTPHCLAIGSESAGVSSAVRALKSRSVSIPMKNGMESLNAAVAAGIIMYALNKIKGE